MNSNDELVERVARAIAKTREGGWPDDTYAMLQQHYRAMARAAIDAMRPQTPALTTVDRENIVDEIESIICETHELDVRDVDYAENIVSWLERHHPDALRAIADGADVQPAPDPSERDKAVRAAALREAIVDVRFCHEIGRRSADEICGQIESRIPADAPATYTQADLEAAVKAERERYAPLIRAAEIKAEEALSSEIPDGYGPEDNAEMQKGYDAGISLIRGALAAIRARGGDA